MLFALDGTAEITSLVGHPSPWEQSKLDEAPPSGLAMLFLPAKRGNALIERLDGCNCNEMDGLYASEEG